MIRVYYKKRQPLKLRKRLKSRAIIRKKISGTKERPRLSVFKSHRHIYGQLIDDGAQVTLVSSCSLAEGMKGAGIKEAEKIGELIASQALKKGIQTAVFDRGGYLYHGKIKSLAEGARKAGLKF